MINANYDTLQPEYIPLRRGSQFVLDSIEASVKKVHWVIQREKPPAGLLISQQPGILDILDLTRLSPKAHNILTLLLLLPFGALLTEILR
jgi:hypothetical protein